ncbi:MAG: hypothetical protein SAK29_32010 [Scytonema sp. PMC 1069.18]|nr:hypothetical protein [Scytonema sp. PMC 1069.18]MEC4884064.1 hypothetical protein [Scytonema sp. PMC 1070.18]
MELTLQTQLLQELMVEGWNITSNTKFHGVRCDYIFMRSPTPDNRKPDNRNETFKDGDFANFIKPNSKFN